MVRGRIVQLPDKSFEQERLERHGCELFVVKYQADEIKDLGLATKAVSRRTATLAELQWAMARVLRLTWRNRFGYMGPITGVVTFSRNDKGALVEHYHLFNEEFNEATFENLTKILVYSLS